MKKILFLLVLLLFITPAIASDFTLENNHKMYNNYEKFLLNDLTFAEKQIFKKTYKRDKLIERLERLELAIFGAIQSGDEISRIKTLRKSVTNVANGGNGLQYTVGNMMGLAGSSLNNFSYGLTNPSYYTNRNYYRRNYSHRPNYRRPLHCSSHRLPPPPRYSARIYPNNQNPYYVNGDFAQNYSLGTSVKILND